MCACSNHDDIPWGGLQVREKSEIQSPVSQQIARERKKKSSKKEESRNTKNLTGRQKTSITWKFIENVDLEKYLRNTGFLQFNKTREKKS